MNADLHGSFLPFSNRTALEVSEVGTGCSLEVEINNSEWAIQRGRDGKRK